MNHIIKVRHIDHYLLPILVELALNGQRVEVLCLVFGNLLAFHRETLSEIAIAVEEANTAEVYVRVGSLLQVVAGEHTQTAAVDLQHLVQTVLHGEVGH